MLDNFKDQPVGRIAVFLIKNGKLALHVVHGIRKYPKHPARKTVFDDLPYGYLDNADRQDADIVEFEEKLLKATDEVNVALVANYKTTLDQDPGLELFALRADGAAATKTIKTRKCMYILFQFIPLVIKKELSPRVAYLILQPAIAAASLLAACANLLDFL